MSVQADRLMPELIACLAGQGNRRIDCHHTPDQLMNLAVLAAWRHGETDFVGARNLRHKECDRLRVVAEELRKVGISIEEHDDGVVVKGRAELQAATLDPHGDHRMAMAFAILQSLHPGIEILDPGCVGKSYPAFFEDLRRIHASPRCIALVGMRGAGKSTLGRELGEKLRLPFLDTDAQFAKLHGPIGAYVEQRGWAAFRREESKIVSNSLRPAHVVALGGGSVLSSATRRLLTERPLVVFLDEPVETLERRLVAGDRPALSSLGAADELASAKSERLPLYRDVADITLPTGLSTKYKVQVLSRELRARCSW